MASLSQAVERLREAINADLMLVEVDPRDLDLVIDALTPSEDVRAGVDRVALVIVDSFFGTDPTPARHRLYDLLRGYIAEFVTSREQAKDAEIERLRSELRVLETERLTLSHAAMIAAERTAKAEAETAHLAARLETTVSWLRARAGEKRNRGNIYGATALYEIADQYAALSNQDEGS